MVWLSLCKQSSMFGSSARNTEACLESPVSSRLYQHQLAIINHVTLFIKMGQGSLHKCHVLFAVVEYFKAALLVLNRRGIGRGGVVFPSGCFTPLLDEQRKWIKLQMSQSFFSPGKMQTAYDIIKCTLKQFSEYMIGKN